MAAPTRYPSGVSVANRGSNVITEAPFKQFVIPVSFADGTGTIETGFSLPAQSILLPWVFVNVRVAEVTGSVQTIDVGLSSIGTDNVITKIDVGSAGLSEASVIKAGVTLGSSLVVDGGVAADVANVPQPFVVDTFNPITWTPGSADFAELQADIILFYQEVRSV